MANIQARNEKKRFRDSKPMKQSKSSLSPSHAAAWGKFLSLLLAQQSTDNCHTSLDLTAASVAYLMEPQWNPMMEEQALCRIHRLGQRKEVKTIRYRIRGSFEDVRFPVMHELVLVTNDGLRSEWSRLRNSRKSLRQKHSRLTGVGMLWIA
jgi:hypothetical protein